MALEHYLLGSTPFCYQTQKGVFLLTGHYYSVIVTGMKLLKEIVAQWGNVNAEQCKELACFFPKTPLIIKWGYLPREEVQAYMVADRIAFVERVQGDYCREVFIKSDSFRQLKGILGVSND
jgi:hypothetical protein